MTTKDKKKIKEYIKKMGHDVVTEYWDYKAGHFDSITNKKVCSADIIDFINNLE